MGAVKNKRMPRAVREQQMLDAAVRTFGQRGYRAASMDEIADLAGVSKPLVYLYLNSKEDLFTACIRREAAALTAAVRAGVHPGLPADRQLWEGLRAFFTHTAQNPDGWAVLHLQARTHGEPFAAEVAAMREELVAFVTQLIAVAAREAHREPPPPSAPRTRSPAWPRPWSEQPSPWPPGPTPPRRLGQAGGGDPDELRLGGPRKSDGRPSLEPSEAVTRPASLKRDKTSHQGSHLAPDVHAFPTPTQFEGTTFRRVRHHPRQQHRRPELGLDVRAFGYPVLRQAASHGPHAMRDGPHGSRKAEP